MYWECAEPDTFVALFADDTSIRSRSRFFKIIKRRLETIIRKYLRYFRLWKIGTNAVKFKAIFITNRRSRQIPTQPLRCGDVSIEWDDVGKYLGLMIDKRLTLKAHIDYALSKALKAIRAIYSLISRRSMLYTNNKIKAYKTAIRPVFTYGAPIILRAVRSHIARLQRFQNKSLRMVLDIRWDADIMRYEATTETIHSEANIEEVETFLHRLTNKHNLRLHSG